MGWFKPGWLVLAGLFCLSAHAELTLKLASPLTPAETLVAERVIERALRALPKSFKAELGAVELTFNDALADKVLGRLTSLQRVELNRRYLSRAPETFSGRSHGSLEQELAATLVHELAHLYDRSFTPSAWQRQCQVMRKTLGEVGLPANCLGQSRRRFRVSDDPRFLDLAGWPTRMGARGVRVTNNFYTDRTPDAYELTRPQEFFAVNFEYFVLDPEYACRRPALFAYLNALFKAYPQPSCPALSFVNAGGKEQIRALAELDLTRLYEVDYLLADPNQNWASRFGHSMLRLVMCAPGRTPGPECRLDLSHHWVLSYRAFVDDLQLSSWQGLTGGYPSRLFILPLAQVVDEYTKVELRSLSSVPLRLSQAQREALVQQAVQSHWSYDGQYFFISNNCAVETLTLLRTGTGHPALKSLESITPTGLLRLLEARGLAQTEVLADSAQAQRLGYWFDSYQARYELMLKVLEQRLGLAPMTVTDWLNKPPSARRQWFNKADTQALAALLLLEQAALRRQLLLAQEELKSRYLTKPAHDLSQTLQQMLAESGVLTNPASVLNQGYGIAQPADLVDDGPVLELHYRNLQRLTDELELNVEGLLSAKRLQTLKATEDNLKRLSRLLKRHVKPLD